MSDRRSTALVTGASSGIGYELACLLAAEGYDLVVVARQKAALEKLGEALQRAHGIRVHVIAADLSDPAIPEAIALCLQKEDVQIDILVNNAGFGTYGHMSETDARQLLNLIQVNITALTHLTRLFLPSMIARGRGKILNVASTAAFQPGPLMAAYYASKAYVLSFSDAVHHEVKGTGVTVTALCPGPTRSEFQKRAGIEHTRLMKGRIMSSKDVALAGLRAMMQGKPRVVPGFRNKLLMVAVRFAPRDVVLHIVRRIQEERQSPK